MIAGLQSYPAYKPSGVPWLGDVPEHWKVRRLKYVCSKAAVYGANVAANQYQAEGVRFLRTTDIAEDGRLVGEGVYLSPEFIEDYVLSDGDILLSRSGTVGRSFLYSANLHGSCAYAGYLVRFVPNQKILPKYLFLFTKTAAFNSFLGTMAISSTIENVNAAKYANGHLPLPPLPEQRAIVRYLDHADRRIRRYVDAKRKLIALLEEEKQAIINHAVTRGLDPNVPLKPSGVDWLGDVPEHWEVRRVKSLSLVKRGASPRPIDDPSYFDDNGEYAWVRIVDVTASNRYLERTTQRLSELGHSLSVRLEPGALFLSIAGSVGKPIITRIRCCIHDGFVYFPQYNGNVEFLYRVFSCHAPFARLGKLGTQLNLNTDTVGDIHLGWPPLREQTSIVEHIEKATADIDTAIARARRQIDLMEEYRTRLIADVVTGKLDVREAAARLPGEADDRDQLEEGGPLPDGMDEDLHASGEFAEELAMPSNIT